MKIKLFVITGLVMVLGFASCQKEELDKSAVPAQTEIENSINAPNTPEEREAIKMRAPLAVVTPVACGYGFTCHIDWLSGGAATGSYYYEITDGVNTWTGNVSDGQNTPWVLSPCTSYTFRFWGSWANPGPPNPPSQTLSVLTDGCGGTFVC